MTINLKLAAKLRKLAEALPDKVTHLRRPLTQNPTPKRMREYNCRVIDGDNLERGRLALLALAAAWERGDVPEVLAGLKNKNEIVPLVRHSSTSSGYYQVASTHAYADTSPAAKALQALLESRLTTAGRAEQAAVKKERELQGLLDRVRFFPTPPAVIRLMLDQAELRPGMRVLEPEAGIGSIADAARAIVGDTVHCVEINRTLCDILQAKGYASTVMRDFMTVPADVLYDRVLMNPPFELGQDCDHVQHAFGFLRPGGRLVAIVSSGVFFSFHKKCADFREWLREFGAQVIDLPDGSFDTAEAFRTTGVSYNMVVIHKSRVVVNHKPGATIIAGYGGEKPTNPLAEALIAGLEEENANPDAEDERFMARALALTDEDKF